MGADAPFCFFIHRYVIIKNGGVNDEYIYDG